MKKTTTKGHHMNDYRPFRINDEEWIITTVSDNEHFPGGPNVYASRKECEAAIEQLRAASPAIIQAAMTVIGCWESGDLAGAVRTLDRAVSTAWGQA
jgi:hypothetical protein